MRPSDAENTSEERFRMLCEACAAGIFIYQGERNVYANAAAEALTGYSREALLQMRFWEIIHPDFRSLVKKRGQARQEGAAVQRRYRVKILTRQGETRWLDYTGGRIQFEGKQAVLGTALDVTEQVLAEQGLRASEQRYRSLVENAPVGIYWVDAAGTLNYANQALLDILAAPSIEAVRARGLEAILPQPEVRAGLSEQLAARGVARLETEVVTQAGKARRILLNATRDAGGVSGMLIDVTEQRRTSEALAQQQQQLAVTLEHVSTGVLSVDPQGRLLFLNRAGAEILDVQGDVSGVLAIELLCLFDERTGAALPDPLVGALRRAELVAFDRPVVLRGASRRERLLTCRAGPIRDSRGEVAGAVMAFEDVTTRRLLEEEAFKNEKLESLGVLAGGLAHDFNNLLCVIEGNLSLAGHCLAMGQDLADPLAQAQLACERSRGLTQQLLTFARGGSPDLRPTSLRDLLRSTVQFSLRGSAVQSEMELEAGLWDVEGDEAQLGQVFHNLVLNSVQAMPRGGRLWVRAANLEKLTDGALPAGPYVRVELEDEGPGVPAELRSRIFDPFFTTKPQGSGLGLPMVHSIVQKHGGRIVLRPRTGKGACFEILLPAASRPVSRQTAQALPAQAQGGRVLVMDDRPGVRKLLVSMLTVLGFESEAAADGAAALELCRKALCRRQPFDLAILDLTVPGGLGGEETMEQIRQLDPRCVGIVASGYSSGSSLRDFERLGFAAALRKPFRVDELLEVVERALAQRPGLAENPGRSVAVPEP